MTESNLSKKIFHSLLIVIAIIGIFSLSLYLTKYVTNDEGAQILVQQFGYIGVFLISFITGLEDDEIFNALSTFKGVEGRLEYVGVTNEGVGIYNDNNATTPQATTMGLKAVGDSYKKNVILIAGGADKNIDLNGLVEAIASYCQTVILIPGNGTDKLVAALADKNIATVLVNNLPEAVGQAVALAKTGNIILFSPAFASFAQYKNEYERNDEFLDLIKMHVN